MHREAELGDGDRGCAKRPCRRQGSHDPRAVIMDWLRRGVGLASVDVKAVCNSLHYPFVLENLLESGFENYENGTSNDESHMRAVLECLSQLHGTGIAYKLFSVSAESNIDSQKSNELDIDMEKRQINKLKEEFPVLEEQIQLKGNNIYIL